MKATLDCASKCEFLGYFLKGFSYVSGSFEFKREGGRAFGYKGVEVSG